MPHPAILVSILAAFSCAKEQPPAPTVIAAQEPAVHWVEVPAFDPALKSREDASPWRSSHQIPDYERPWSLQPWQADLANGLEQAWRESKPLLLWLEDRHPFGGADARARTLRTLWTEPGVREQSRTFVLIADDLRELQAIRASHPGVNAWLTRLENETPLRPGIYCATPAGDRLAGTDALDAEGVIAACATASAAWAKQSGAFPPPAPPERPGPLPRFARRSDHYPIDGMAVEFMIRGCDDPALGAPSVLETPWYRDWIWMEQADQQLLVPPGQGTRKAGAWPQGPAASFARTALSDALSDGEIRFATADVTLAQVDVRFVSLRKGRQTFAISGVIAAARGGVRESEPGVTGPLAACRWRALADGDAMARGKLLGWMDVDLNTGKIMFIHLTGLVQLVNAGGLRHHLVLARNQNVLEEGSRFAPTVEDGDRARAAQDLSGPLPRRYRLLHADRAPELDGSLNEATWTGVPWSEEFAGGARTKFVWNSERIYGAVWSPQPRLEFRLGSAEGPNLASTTLVIEADGSTSGQAGARATVRAVDQAWVFEFSVPWIPLMQAGFGEMPPAAGSILPGNVGIGAHDALQWWSPAEIGEGRLLFEASRSLDLMGGGGGLR